MKNAQTKKNTLSGWQVRKLGSMFDIKRGGSPRPIEAYVTDRGDGLNWLKIGDIDVGAKYITHTSSKILKQGLKMTTLVKKGDFILSNSMSFGRPYIMNIDSCIHDGWLTFQNIKTEMLNRDYLYYLLSHPKTQAEFQSISAGSGVQNLKKETVSEIALVIPPLPEQNRIVVVLETWDKAIELLGKKIELKKKIKKGLMQRLLNGKTRLSGFSDPWRVVKLGEVCDIKRGDMITSKDLVAGDVPVIAGGKQPAYYHNKSNYSGKTITVSGSGASAGHINYFNGPIFASDCSVVKNKEGKSEIDFVYYILHNKQEYIYSLQTGGAQPHVYPKDLSKIKVSIPDIKEQTAIGTVILASDLNIRLLEQKTDWIKKQKKYLLNNLITGAIRTPESLMIK